MVKLKLSSVETSLQMSSPETSPHVNSTQVSAPPRGGGHCFWCGSTLRRRWRQSSLFEKFHLRNIWVESDQTCMITLPRQRKNSF